MSSKRIHPVKVQKFRARYPNFAFRRLALAHVGLARHQLALGADKNVELGDQRFGTFLPDGAATSGEAPRIFFSIA